MQYPGLWFEDGDFVLQTASASFLIHKRVLCKSPVFKQILLSNHFDRHPEHKDAVMWTVEDPTEDLAALLYCLYSVIGPSAGTNPLGLLRLCQKYVLPILAAELIAKFKRAWPTSLAAWDQHEAHIRALSIAHAAAPHGQIASRYLDDCLPEPAAVVALAREFVLPELLPSALYALSLLRPAATHATFRARLTPEVKDALAAGARSARWDLLTAPDLLRLAKGQDRLRSQRTLTHALTVAPPQRSPACAAGCEKLLAALRELGERSPDVLGALTYLRLYICEPGQARRLGICGGCAEGVCKTIAALRLQIWRSLPEWFDVRGVVMTA
ncbi:hypothetical protein C8R46DRAFT_1189784 [Mycena filopes]|nr:hypothetical protein C8R46DRAFT_1189784 [Mycena filopes]